jgi:hypothetical protein
MLKRDQALARKLFADDTRTFQEIERRRLAETQGGSQVDEHKRQLEDRRRSLLAGAIPCSPTKQAKKNFDIFVKPEPSVASSSRKSGEDIVREAKLRGEEILRQARLEDAQRHAEYNKEAAWRVWKPQMNPASNPEDVADDADRAGIGAAMGPTEFTSIDEKNHIEKLFKGIASNDSAVITPIEKRLATPQALRVSLMEHQKVFNPL